MIQKLDTCVFLLSDILGIEVLQKKLNMYIILPATHRSRLADTGIVHVQMQDLSRTC